MYRNHIQDTFTRQLYNNKNKTPIQDQSTRTCIQDKDTIQIYNTNIINNMQDICTIHIYRKRIQEKPTIQIDKTQRQKQYRTQIQDTSNNSIQQPYARQF